MIDAMAKKLAVSIKNIVPNHPASVNVLVFAIAAVLNGVFIVSLSMLISLFTHKTLEAALVLFSFAALRQLSGGLHLKSGVACVIVSTTGVTLLSLVEIDNRSLIFSVNVVSVLLAIIFSPSGIEKQTRINKKYFPLLKISSTILVATNFYFNSTILAVTFFLQCLTLIKNPWSERRE